MKPEDEPTMIFDRDCKVLHNYDDELINLFNEVCGPISLAELFDQNVQH